MLQFGAKCEAKRLHPTILGYLNSFFFARKNYFYYYFYVNAKAF